MELVGGELAELPDDAPATLVDNRGMLCAQGILRLMRAMVPLEPAALVKVLSTDPAAEHDYPAWCRATGHRFLGHQVDGRPGGAPLIASFVRKRTADAAT
jgi:tRNA 2-thiouridine synthesizing protein A